MTKTDDKLLLRALKHGGCDRAPMWLMRQAGRYLPEYRATRAKSRDFLHFCYTPELAIEVTLQPIRRYGFDAAIMFSDILVLPDALGQKVWFEEGRGPLLEALREDQELEKLRLDGLHTHLDPVYQVLKGLKVALPSEVALIGFAGAPWTLATYMIEGGSSRDFHRTKKWSFQNRESFGRLIQILVDGIVEYFVAQVSAGAEVLQLFDSWAGVLDEQSFGDWVIKPTREIVTRVKARCPDVPIIGFPRACGVLYQRFVEETGVDAVSIDPSIPLSWAKKELSPLVAVQGNLDPILLVAGGERLKAEVQSKLQTMKGEKYIFNLGHGIVPETPPEHVAQVVEWVKAGV